MGLAPAGKGGRQGGEGVLGTLFSGGRTGRAAEDLLLAASEASRQPALYGPAGAPDTLEGRLEMLMLHGCLALIRLQREPAARPLAQRFTDKLFRHIDAGLRESGVGDLSVPRRMRQAAGKFYGRLDAYAAALAQGEAAVAAALARNVGPAAEGLAGHVRALHAKQAGAPAEALRRSEGWRL